MSTEKTSEKIESKPEMTTPYRPLGLKAVIAEAYPRQLIPPADPGVGPPHSPPKKPHRSPSASRLMTTPMTTSSTRQAAGLANNGARNRAP
ncbi:hypothetical protein PMI07_002906 [Rhizobium sp. CF080]|nr:hypothetical protein PMI07_002906 [Rhizobium sp. CF080]